MKRFLTVAVLLLSCFVMAGAQGRVMDIRRGEPAESIDQVIQKKIELAVQKEFPNWRRLSRREENNFVSLTWATGEGKITTYVYYYLSSEEAAKEVQWELIAIEMPRYKPFADVGDEAYLIQGKGPILFKRANIVASVDGYDASIDTLKQIARLIAEAVKAG